MTKWNSLDHDDEMELHLVRPTKPSRREWIDKEKAQALIAHLTKVFNLNP